MPPSTDMLLKAALPALGFASYLDAKYSLSYDYTMITSFALSRFDALFREYCDRLCPFYLLESLGGPSAKPADQARAFVIYQGREYSYRESYDLVLRYATWLRERHGVQKGEVVALDFMNKSSFIWIWFALWAAGAKPAMMNYNLGGERLIHCVNTSRARLIIIDAEVGSVVEEGETRAALEDGGKRNVVVFDAATERVVETWKGVRPDDKERAGAGGGDMAMLIYTSGTTGMPKAAVISWNKCTFGPGFAIRWMGMTKHDRFYTCMPVYHTSAAILGVLSVLNTSSTLILGHKFSTRTFWPEVREQRATIIQYVGETCRYLLSAPPTAQDKSHKVRIAFGNGLRPDIWKRFKERFGIPIIGEFYASTEGMSGAWNLQRGEFAIGAVGRNGALVHTLLGSTVKLVRVDYDTETPWRDPKTGFCFECDWDEVGECLWRVDPNDIQRSFQGYYGNSKATSEKIIRDVFKSGDAWFRTGDVQKVSRDGLWYFVDRIGDTFRWKSENVSTNEVAEVVGSFPLVVETSAYGVELPAHDGRCGCAAVTFAKEAFLETGDVREDVLRDLATHVIKNLPGFARPVFLRVTREIQRTGNNKQVKNVLRKEGVNPDLVGTTEREKKVVETKDPEEGKEMVETKEEKTEVWGPEKDVVYWLRKGTYVGFKKRDWEGIRGGSIKL